MMLNGLKRRGRPGAVGGCSAGPSTVEPMRCRNRTGASVKDNARLAISARHTDTDKGENRYLAVPWSRKIGTKTIQMHSVESMVGAPTSPAPLTIASRNG